MTSDARAEPLNAAPDAVPALAAPPASPAPARAEAVTPGLASAPPEPVASVLPPASAPGSSASVFGVLPTWLSAVLAALVVAVLFSLWFGLQSQRQVHALEQEIVKRQQETASLAAESRTLSKSAQDVSRDAAAKVALLDTRLGEVALQRSQLEELMQSLTRSRDENIVTDIDSAIRVSLQQVAITGSTEPLVVALRSAEERLARISSTQPRLDAVRRAIARDLDRVRAVGVADMGALLIKLDECIRLIDELPLTSGSAAKSPNAVPVRSAAPAASAPPEPAPQNAVGRFFKDGAVLLAVVWGEVRSLVRVTRIDQPESMLIAPDQSFMLRENLKLRLLNARLALLSRQAESAQGDLQNAMSAISRYFDASSRRTQIALELLKQVAAQGRQTSLPRPDETLTALAAAAAGR